MSTLAILKCAVHPEHEMPWFNKNTVHSFMFTEMTKCSNLSNHLLPETVGLKYFHEFLLANRISQCFDINHMANEATMLAPLTLLIRLYINIVNFDG